MQLKKVYLILGAMGILVAVFSSLGSAITWENSHGRLTVTPDIAYNWYGQFKQHWELENKDPVELCVNVAFLFEKPITNSGVYKQIENLFQAETFDHYEEQIIWIEENQTNESINISIFRNETYSQLSNQDLTAMFNYYLINPLLYGLLSTKQHAYATSSVCIPAGSTISGSWNYQTDGSGKWDLVVWNTVLGIAWELDPYFNSSRYTHDFSDDHDINTTLTTARISNGVKIDWDDIAENISACWTFDNDDMFGSAGFLDQTGNDYDLNPYSPAGTKTGKPAIASGESVGLSGADTGFYINSSQINGASPFNLSGKNFTIAFYGNLSNSDSHRSIFARQYFNGDASYGVSALIRGVGGNDAYLLYSDYCGGWTADDDAGDPDWDDGMTHFLALIWNTSEFTAMINNTTGMEKSNWLAVPGDLCTRAVPIQNFTFFGYQQGSSVISEFLGSVDELMFWSRDLSITELEEINDNKYGCDDVLAFNISYKNYIESELITSNISANFKMINFTRNDSNFSAIDYQFSFNDGSNWADLTNGSYINGSAIGDGFIWNATLSSDISTYSPEIYSVTFDFLYNILPNKTTLDYPSNASTVTSVTTTLNFSSNDSDDPTVFYYVFTGTNQSNLTLYWNGTANSTAFTGADGETYYWKVIANDFYENSTDSDIYRFTISLPTSPAGSSIIGGGGSFEEAIKEALVKPTCNNLYFRLKYLWNNLLKEFTLENLKIFGSHFFDFILCESQLSIVDSDWLINNSKS